MAKALKDLTYEEEQKICKEFLVKNRFFKWLWLRYYHGYQSFVIVTGDTNSGKSIFANMIYYILTTGMYDNKINLNDFYFGVKDIVANLAILRKKCVINHEAGKKSKNWNDIQNEMWSQILQFGRVFRNTYIDCLPHRKDMTDTHLKHATFLIVVDNIIKDYIDSKENIEDYEIIRIARVYKFQVDYLGFNSSSQGNSFVTPIFFDYFIIPDYRTDIRFRNFKKFIENEYKPFDLKSKENLMTEIEEKSRANDAKTKMQIDKFIKKMDKEKLSKSSDLGRFL